MPQLSEKMTKFVAETGTLSPTEKLDLRAIIDAGSVTDGALASTALQPEDVGTASAYDVGTGIGDIPVLDGSSKIPSSLLPVLPVSDTIVTEVADQAARLALSLSAAQGTIIVQTDNGNSYALITGGDQTVLGDWVQVGGAGGGAGDALVANNLDQFANVTQVATKTLAINESTILAGGTHSGINTGNQTSIVGITGTKAQFNTALTDGDFATLQGLEELQNKTLTQPNIDSPTITAGGTMDGTTLSSCDLGTPTAGILTNCTGTAAGLTAGNVTTNANLTGDVTSVGNATTISALSVTNAKLANVATKTFKGRTSATTGVVEDLTVAQARELIGLPTEWKTASFTAEKGKYYYVDTSAGIVTVTNPTMSAPSENGHAFSIQHTHGGNDISINGSTYSPYSQAARYDVSFKNDVYNTAHTILGSGVEVDRVFATGMTEGQIFRKDATMMVADDNIPYLGNISTASGSTHDFTSIPFWANRITITFYAIATSATSPFIIQLGDAGGFETNDYYGGVSYDAGRALHTTGFWLTTANVANKFYHGTLVLTRHAAGNRWMASCNLAREDVGYVYSMGGSKSTSGNLDRIRLTTVAGSAFNAGSIALKYE